MSSRKGVSILDEIVFKTTNGQFLNINKDLILEAKGEDTI